MSGSHGAFVAAAAPSQAALVAIERAFADSFSAALGVRVELALAAAPVAARDLSLCEAARLAQFDSPARQDGWRRGRAALKRLLGRFGLQHDTSELVFPHARLSLSHAGPLAVAAGLVDGATDGFGGIGVDLELDRAPRIEAARFFLCAEEQAWIAGQPAETRSRELLRLWTVKEALFKADRDNSGAGLHEYRTAQAAPARRGLAMRAGGGRFAYSTQRLASGLVTVAVALPEGGRDAQ